MRLMFVYWHVENAGSAQTILNYAEAARDMGHEVVLFAPPTPHSPFHCSQDVESADAVIFLLEWNIYLHKNKPLDLEGAISRSRRDRRFVIDNDGMYHAPIDVDGDYNHLTEADSRERIELYDSISDQIFQPTYHPTRPNVRTFLFHGYNPRWAQPLSHEVKPFGMTYVGSNWFRWRPMTRVLKAIEPVRSEVGRIGLAGHDWTEPPWGVESPLRERAYATDPEYLARLEVELSPAVPVDQVIPFMGQGIFTPVLVRPLFNHFRLVNPRLFETPAANTTPLFCLDPEYVEEIYGKRALELVFPHEDPERKIRDMLNRPSYYAEIVEELRAHLAAKHSFAARVRELIGIVSA